MERLKFYILIFLLTLFCGGCYGVTSEIRESPLENFCIPLTEDIQPSNSNTLTISSPKKIVLGGVSNTGSMLPTFGEKATLIISEEVSDLSVGDIIVFHSGVIWNKLTGEDRVIHRIIGIDEDLGGTYYVTKGDNLKHIDNTKIRFENITGKVIGILYSDSVELVSKC